MTATVDAPPAPPESRARRMVPPLATIGALSAATAALHVRDPHSSGSWGFCPSAAMGFWCPGCGGLRAVNDLTNGDVGAALSSNVVVTAMIPVAVVLLVLWSRSSWRGRGVAVRWERLRPVLWAFLTVVLVFTVMRNTGPGAWLAP